MKTKDFQKLSEETVEIEGKPRPASEFLGDYYKTLGDGTLELLGIKTGFEKLNKATLGLDGLIVLGGIPKVGKTSLALQLAFSASDEHIPTLFYSLEMNRKKIFTRILSRLAKVKASDILLKGRQYLTDTEGKKLFSDNDAQRLKTGRELLETIGDKFYLRTRERDEAEINFDTVEQEINFIKAHHKAERVFVVIDHLQVFNAGEYKDQIDKEGKLITGFKGISERTGAVILLISQKNKASFNTSGGLQSIKGSVDIVYLADTIMFLDTAKEKKARKNYSKRYSKNNFCDEELDSLTGYYDPDVDLIIESRDTPHAVIKMKFNGEYSEFSEV